MQLINTQLIIKAFGCDCINSTTPDNVETKDGIITNAITAINGIMAHTFAFVYPTLKYIGTCIPVIAENTKNDKLNPSIISGALTIVFLYNAKQKLRAIIVKKDIR